MNETERMLTIHRPLEEMGPRDALELALFRRRRLPYLALVESVLSEDECAALIERVEREGMEIATINGGPGRAYLNPNVRNNDRLIFDDEALAETLWQRLRSAVPAEIDGRVAVSMNERFRAYRYRPGQKFAPHFDGCFARNDDEASEITVIIYLNAGCGGGETAFLDLELAVRPSTGVALLFEHQVLHEGREVTSGVKYALRTDVMYRAQSSQAQRALRHSSDS